MTDKERAERIAELTKQAKRAAERIAEIDAQKEKAKAKMFADMHQAYEAKQSVHGIADSFNAAIAEPQAERLKSAHEKHEAERAIMLLQYPELSGNGDFEDSHNCRDFDNGTGTCTVCGAVLPGTPDYYNLYDGE